MMARSFNRNAVATTALSRLTVFFKQDLLRSTNNMAGKEEALEILSPFRLKIM